MAHTAITPATMSRKTPSGLPHFASSTSAVVLVFETSSSRTASRPPTASTTRDARTVKRFPGKVAAATPVATLPSSFTTRYSLTVVDQQNRGRDGILLSDDRVRIDAGRGLGRSGWGSQCRRVDFADFGDLLCEFLMALARGLLEDAEIFGLETLDVMALVVLDDDIESDHAGVAFEGGGGRRGLCRLGLRCGRRAL